MRGSRTRRASTVAQERVAIAPLRDFIAYAGAKGLPAEAIAIEAGCSAEDLADPWAMIASECFLAAIEALHRTTGEFALGTNAAMHMELHHYNVAAYYFGSLSTLGESMGEAFRLARELRHQARPTLEVSDQLATARFRNIPGDQPGGRIYGTYSVALTVFMARMHSPEPLAPLEVSLSEPSGEQGYSAFFGCPIRFDAPEVSIRFPADWLKLPNPRANLGLAKVLGQQMEERVRAVAAPDDIIHRSRVALDACLERAEAPSLAAVAGALAMSPRTLQKRLKQAGVSYRELRDEERRARLIPALLDADSPLEEVAAELGFDDVSSLSRAVRRWYDESPARYRRRLLGFD